MLTGQVRRVDPPNLNPNELDSRPVCLAFSLLNLLTLTLTNGELTAVLQR